MDKTEFAVAEGTLEIGDMAFSSCLDLERRGVRARPHHGHALAQKGGRDDKGQPGLQPGGRRAEAEIKINRIIA